LTVTNSSGSKSASQTLAVLPTFAASFTYSPSSPAINQAVQFTDTSTGSPTAWQWNFGDNATSTIQNPSHTFTAVGQYWVNLIITKGADSHSASQLITVRQPGTITAASPSYADVSAAVSAAISGDTVIVPAGSATWNNNLVIKKGIFLIGAGIGQTVITSNYTQSDTGFGNACFLLVYEPSNPAANEPFRLSGFTWDLATKCQWLKLSYRPTSTPIYIPNKIRIDHNRVINPNASSGRFIVNYGQMYGVADNNEFVGGLCMRAFGMDNLAWNNLTFNYGSADNFYLEDNTITITNNEICYGEAGGRYCIRHNTVTLTTDAFSLIDAHGNAAWSGTMGLEVYENTINAGGHYMSLVDHRGGKGLIYNNNVSNTSSTYIQVREEVIDGSGGQPQHVSSSYYWNNLLNGSLVPAKIAQTVNYGSPLGLVPQWDRECWQQVVPFTGTTGMGVGLLSARPATCTTGVGYWATDTQTLYRATATNTWEVYYRPYSYPHPLRSLLSGQGATEK